MEPRDITVKGFEMVEKKVRKSGTGGYVYCPARWMGKKIAVILLEPIE